LFRLKAEYGLSMLPPNNSRIVEYGLSMLPPGQLKIPFKGPFQSGCTSVIRMYMSGDFVRKSNQNWSKTAEFGWFGPVLIEFSPWPKAMYPIGLFGVKRSTVMSFARSANGMECSLNYLFTVLSIFSSVIFPSPHLLRDVQKALTPIEK
jgi:hypothetical protein